MTTFLSKAEGWQSVHEVNLSCAIEDFKGKRSLPEICFAFGSQGLKNG